MYILLIYGPFESSICHYDSISSLLSDWDFNSLSDFSSSFSYKFELFHVDLVNLVCSNFDFYDCLS